MLRPIATSLGLLVLLAGCGEERVVVADPVATAPEVGPDVATETGGISVVERRSGLRALFGLGRDETVVVAEETPVLAWAHRPEGERWTEATLAALKSHGAALPASEPDNIEAWCPAYAEAPMEDREAFWAGLISALAKHESTWRAEAVGGGGRWFGLVQIAPGTADAYGCAAQSGSALKDGVANLSCAVRILAAQRPDDRPVHKIASDWGPFHSAQKRDEMRAWVSAQPFCQGASREG